MGTVGKFDRLSYAVPRFVLILGEAMDGSSAHQAPAPSRFILAVGIDPEYD